MTDKILFKVLAAGAIALLVACSSTTLSGSWKSPDYRGQIHKTYIVGVAKNETTRRMFEDQFAQELQTYGVTGVSSYKDIPDSQNASQETISARVNKSGADSVLMTRVTGKRTEEVVTPGRISGYDTGPRYGGYPYSPSPYYRNWGSYYDRRFEATYEPATVTQFQVATIEANLYDATSGNLIWSAQLDTIIEDNIQKLVGDFIKTVTKDLRQQGLI